MGSSGKDIIERIDRRLDALGVSQNSASVRAGLSRDAIRSVRRNIESRRGTGVSSETLKKLAPALQTSVVWLLTGEGPETVADGAEVEPAEENISAVARTDADPDQEMGRTDTALRQAGLDGADPLNVKRILAKRMRVLRLSEGYPTTASFAAFLGIDHKLLSMIEHGHPMPLEVAQKITAKTGADYNWLLDGRDNNLPLGLRNRLIAAAQQLEQDS